MINILEHDNDTKIHTCQYCKCKFSFNREDCFWDKYELSYKMWCPKCGERLLLGDIFDD